MLPTAFGDSLISKTSLIQFKNKNHTLVHHTVREKLFTEKRCTTGIQKQWEFEVFFKYRDSVWKPAKLELKLDYQPIITGEGESESDYRWANLENFEKRVDFKGIWKKITLTDPHNPAQTSPGVFGSKAVDKWAIEEMSLCNSVLQTVHKFTAI